MSSTLKYKVGDTVVITGNTSGHDYPLGTYVVIEGIVAVLGGLYRGSDYENDFWYFDDDECTLAIQKEMTPVPEEDISFDIKDYTDNSWIADLIFPLVSVETPNKTSSGGPSSYYDMPYELWVTTNDQMEYLAEHKWGKYAIHLKDIFKGLCRWGDKSGTTVEYDSRKIIYYGCRVLKMVVGTNELRAYLNELLNDKQFNDKGGD
jgi:hypothetical protein